MGIVDYFRKPTDGEIEALSRAMYDAGYGPLHYSYSAFLDRARLQPRRFTLRITQFFDRLANEQAVHQVPFRHTEGLQFELLDLRPRLEVLFDVGKAKRLVDRINNTETIFWLSDYEVSELVYVLKKMKDAQNKEQESLLEQALRFAEIGERRSQQAIESLRTPLTGMYLFFKTRQLTPQQQRILDLAKEIKPFYIQEMGEIAYVDNVGSLAVRKIVAQMSQWSLDESEEALKDLIDQRNGILLERSGGVRFKRSDFFVDE